MGATVRVTIAEEVALLLVKGDAVPSGSPNVAEVETPNGFVPSRPLVETTDWSGRMVSASDEQRWTLIDLGDGRCKRWKLNKEIDLTGFNPGDPVTVRATRPEAIAVQLL